MGVKNITSAAAVVVAEVGGGGGGGGDLPCLFHGVRQLKGCSLHPH